MGEQVKTAGPKFYRHGQWFPVHQDYQYPEPATQLSAAHIEPRVGVREASRRAHPVRYQVLPARAASMPALPQWTTMIRVVLFIDAEAGM